MRLVSLSKKAEIQNDWIQRLEATEKDPLAFSLNELDNVTHQQVPAYRIRRNGSKNGWMQNILDGANIIGMCRHGHGHTDQQLALLDRAGSEEHVESDHFGGEPEHHRDYHQEETV